MDVTYFETNKNFNLDKQNQFLNLILPFMSDESLFRKIIYRKPLTNFSIEADYTRYLKNDILTITDADKCKDVNFLKSSFFLLTKVK